MQALVFLGGAINRTSLTTYLIDNLNKDANDSVFVVAADQGAATSLNFGIIPNLVIGDFDSVNPAVLPQLEQLGSQIERYPERKNATDGELVVDELLKSACKKVLILTALGPIRPDHSLMNIALMQRIKRSGVDVALSDGYSLLLAINGKEQKAFSFANEFGYRPFVSFMSTGKTLENLRYTGLSYDLENDLERGSSQGTSNYPAYFDTMSKKEFLEKENEVWNFAFSVDAGEGLMIVTPQD